MTDFDTSNTETTGTESAQERRGFRGEARQRAIDAYDNARSSISGAGRRASETLDEAPLIALAGGIAAGALIAALLPRTEAEERALRPVGKRVKVGAKAAVRAAKDAGTSRLDELGLTRDRASEAVRSIFEGASEAARTSAKAALDSSRNRS